jgi:hypothetical protein
MALADVSGSVRKAVRSPVEDEALEGDCSRGGPMGCRHGAALNNHLVADGVLDRMGDSEQAGSTMGKYPTPLKHGHLPSSSLRSCGRHYVPGTIPGDLAGMEGAVRETQGLCLGREQGMGQRTCGGSPV